MKRLTFFLKTPGDASIVSLLLRIWLGIGLFTNHGWEKLGHFSQMPAHFPDPIHIGRSFSFFFAFFTDSICSLLIAVGILTRITSAFLVVNLLVAFLLFWHADLLKIDGELAFIYLGGYIAVMVLGPGKYSVDNLM